MATENDPPDLAILNDVNHPDHAAWQRGDPALVARVENAFKLKYGTEEISESGLSTDEPPLDLDPELAEIKARYESGGNDDPQAEREAIAKENHEIEMTLRQDPDWADYDVALRGSMLYARELVEGDDELYHAIAQSINEKLGPAGQIKMLKQLWKMAARGVENQKPKQKGANRR